MKNNKQNIVFIVLMMILGSCNFEKSYKVKVEESNKGISQTNSEIDNVNVLNLFPDSTHNFQPLDSKFVEEFISNAKHQYLLGVDLKDSSVVYFAQDIENAYLKMDGKLDKLTQNSTISISEYDYTKNYFQNFQHTVSEKPIQVFTTSKGQMYIYYFDDGFSEGSEVISNQSISKLQLKLIQINP